MKKFITILIHIFIIFFLVAIEVSAISFFPRPFNNLGLVLPAIIYLAVVFNLNFALWWSVVAGFFLDIYSLLPFGAIMIALIITTFCAHRLFLKHFTNRSLYSLLFLGFLGTIIYKGIILGISFLPFLFGKDLQIFYFNFNLLKITFAAIILNSLFLILLFYLTNLFSKRLKPAYM